MVVLIGYVWRSHDRRIANNEDNIRKVSQTVADLGSQQEAFKGRVNERLQEYEVCFGQMEDQVQALKSSVERVDSSVEQLADINRRLSDQVQVLDKRIYEQKS